MLTMTLGEIALAIGGKVHDADPNTQVTALVTFDTRHVVPGSLYVALQGARVDGHDFAAAALAAGAVAVLAARPVGMPAVVVDDVLVAYGRLAGTLVARVPEVTVVGVTGSVGKTTTKDLIGQVLSRLGPTIAPPGNRNSESGMPETVSRLLPESRFLVLEMAARRVGDIAYLTSAVRPSVGVVLNVGLAHVGVFGSPAAVASAKGELAEALPDDGVAILCADDPVVAAMQHRTAAEVVTFGRSPAADVHAGSVVLDTAARACFTLHAAAGSAPVALAFHGEHFVSNALAAAAVALRFTDDVALVAAALSDARPVSEGRMVVTERPDGVTVIDDAYNASPASMGAALRAMETMAHGRRAVAVLGEMRELGDFATDAHMAVGKLAAQRGVEVVLAVGGVDAARLAEAAAGSGLTATHLTDRDQLAPVLRGLLRPGDVVLLKGSNGVGLMAVADQLAGKGH